MTILGTFSDVLLPVFSNLVGVCLEPRQVCPQFAFQFPLEHCVATSALLLLWPTFSK